MSIKLRTPFHVTLLTSGSAPAGEAGTVKLYVRSIDGTPELFVIDSLGTETQVTNGGIVVSGSLENSSGFVDIAGSAAPTVGQVLTATGGAAATWQDPTGGGGGGTAEFIGTTGADVAVGAAAPPSTGQTLIATSATTATWQTIVVPVASGVSGLGAGVAAFLATPSSANLATAVTGETGTGALVFGTSPTLVTPALGTPSAATLTNATGLPISSGVSGLGTGVATFLGTPSSANLAAALTDETGTGANVFANSPALVTPTLGTPASATLTNATGLPISTGVAGLGTGVAAFLATPSSANLATALTDETGGGAAVFATSPTLVTPALGTPSALVLTNATGRASSSQTADKLATSGTPVDIGNTPPLSGQVLQASGATTAAWATLSAGPASQIATSGTPVSLGSTPPTTGQILQATSATTAVWTTKSVAIGSEVSGLGTGVATLLGTPSSANLAAAITDETGSGALVFATSPSLVTPNLGTPSAITLTSATGLPISTGVSGLGTGVATFLATPSSANLAAALTDETGSGVVVLATSPTLVTPALGTPSALVLTNATGRASSSQTADQIATSGSPVVISSTAPTNGQVLTASSGTAASWQTPSGSSAGAVALYVPPASPNANDKEFDIDADVTGNGFQVWDQNAGAAVTPSGAVDRLTSFGGTTPRHNLPSVGRKSFYHLQVPPATGNFHFVTWTPAVAFPSTGFFYCRMGAQKHPACRYHFGLFAASGGDVDVNNFIAIGQLNTSGVKSIEFLSNNGGVPGNTTVLADNGCPQWEYFGIERHAGGFTPWVWNDAGDVLTLTGVGAGLIPARWGFKFRPDGNLSAVLSVDFMRQASSRLGIIE